MSALRTVLLAAVAALTLWGCGGGGELTLTEYVDRVEAMIADAGAAGEELFASPEGAVLAAEGAALDEYTPQDLEVALLRIGEIEEEFLDEADDIEPPPSVADFHELYFDDTFTKAREALAARAATAADWVELSATDEMAAYRAAVARDKQVCLDAQADLDATAQRGAFADNPWVPGRLKEIIDAALGCSAFPEDPATMFNPEP